MSRATLGALKAAIERGALKAAPVSQLAAYCDRMHGSALALRCANISRADFPVSCDPYNRMGFTIRRQGLLRLVVQP